MNTTIEQQIKDIETRWWRLVQQRQMHYNSVLSEVDKRFQFGIIKELNENMDYEGKFDAMEAELRKLAPNHDYLEENQININ